MKILIFLLNYIDFKIKSTENKNNLYFILSDNFYKKWTEQFFFIFFVHFFFISDHFFCIIFFDIKNEYTYPLVFNKNYKKIIKKNNSMALTQFLFFDEICLYIGELEIKNNNINIFFDTFYFILFLCKLILKKTSKNIIQSLVINLCNTEHCMNISNWKNIIRLAKKNNIVLDYYTILMYSCFFYSATETKGINCVPTKYFYKTLLEKYFVGSNVMFFFSFYSRQLFNLPLFNNIKTNHITKTHVTCSYCFSGLILFSIKCFVCGSYFFFSKSN